MTRTAFTLSLSLALLTAMPAFAQEAELWPLRDQEPVLLDDWTYADVYRGGFLGKALIGADLAGSDGEVIGQVEEVMIAPGGKVVSLIVGRDGLALEGSNRFTIPWMDLIQSRGPDALVAPFTAAAATDFRTRGAEAYSAAEARYVTGGVDRQIQAERRVMKLTNFLGNKVRYATGRTGGAVEDVVVDQNGYVRAVLVSTGAADGIRAVPFQTVGVDWSVLDNAYPLPYRRVEVEALPTFRTSRLSGQRS